MIFLCLMLKNINLFAFSSLTRNFCTNFAKGHVVMALLYSN